MRAWHMRTRSTVSPRRCLSAAPAGDSFAALRALAAPAPSLAHRRVGSARVKAAFRGRTLEPNRNNNGRARWMGHLGERPLAELRLRGQAGPAQAEEEEEEARN